MKPTFMVGALAAALAVVILVTANRQQPRALTGSALVLDGDSIVVHGLKVRLFGIDAPELHQTCETAAGKPWLCGFIARDKLAELIDHRVVSCERVDIDRYSRIVATCMVDKIDLGAELVAQGMAVAYRRYSSRYVAVEATARTARVGIWQGRFEQPEAWRIANPRK